MVMKMTLFQEGKVQVDFGSSKLRPSTQIQNSECRCTDSGIFTKTFVTSVILPNYSCNKVHVTFNGGLNRWYFMAPQKKKSFGDKSGSLDVQALGALLLIHRALNFRFTQLRILIVLCGTFQAVSIHCLERLGISVSQIEMVPYKVPKSDFS